MVLVKVVEPLSDFHFTSWRIHVQPTAVCRLWRSVALHTPAYWSCIPFDAYDNAEEILSRSKTHPLSLRLVLLPWETDDNEYKTSRIQEAFQRHLTTLYDGRRLEELHLEGTISNLEQFPRNEAPILRSLKLISYNQRATLPIHVLSSARQALRHLRLEHARVDWKALPDSKLQIGNLSSLHIRDIKPPFPAEIVWQLISSSPNLEAITMRSALPHDFEPPIKQATQRVSLAKLRSVDVKGTLQASVYLLLLIGLPKNPRITLETDDHLPILEDKDNLFITRLLEVCRMSCRNKAVRKYKELSLAITNTHTLVKMGNTGLPSAEEERAIYRYCDMEKDWEVQLTLRAPAIATICEVLKVRGLEHLQLDLHIHGSLPLSSEQVLQHQLPSSEQWRSLFLRHPNITALRLDSVPMTDLTAALESSTNAAAPSRKGSAFYGTFVLPRLARLTVNWPRMKDGDKERFANMLLARSKAGIAFREVKMWRCEGINFDHAEILQNTLRSYGTVIDWDDPDL